MNRAVPYLVFLVLVIAAAAARAESFELVPGVVVDPGADALYLMVPGGGVEKVSLAAGQRQWTSDGAAKPLAVYGDQVLAQVEAGAATGDLEVVLLDAAGGAVRNRLRVALPDGLRAAVDDGMARTFTARGRVQGPEPVVTWHHEERYTKGIAPAPNEPLRQDREGAFRLDLAAARMVSVEPVTPAAPTAALPPAVQAWIASHGVGEAPVQVGSVIAATQLVGGITSPSGRVVLKRWAAAGGVALPDIELFRGPHVVRLRSADDRHLLIAERRAPGDLEEYEWSVVSLETGERVGQLRHHRSQARFFVAGRSLVLVEQPFARQEGGELIERPRRLRAVVLGSGSTVWERPLRDTAYYGPFPP